MCIQWPKNGQFNGSELYISMQEWSACIITVTFWLKHIKIIYLYFIPYSPYSYASLLSIFIFYLFFSRVSSWLSHATTTCPRIRCMLRRILSLCVSLGSFERRNVKNAMDHAFWVPYKSHIKWLQTKQNDIRKNNPKKTTTYNQFIYSRL